MNATSAPVEEVEVTHAVEPESTVTAVADVTAETVGEVTHIRPRLPWSLVGLAELWRYRDLLTLLIWRDISARYRQSVVGYGWAVIKPVTSMLIFTFIFGRVAGIESDGSPYALFSFTALLPWMYFAGALTSTTMSLSGSAALLKKVYFPRMILPVVGIVTGLVELAIQFVVLAALMWWYGCGVGWQLICLPAFVGLAVATAFAFGLWLTALNVKYRDVGMGVPFLVQAWMWLSPVVYSSSDVPERFRLLYNLNPMVGVIEGFRWSLLGTTTPDWPLLAASVGCVAVVLVSGLVFFRHAEAQFADVV